jgi:hypothetical protein
MMAIPAIPAPEERANMVWRSLISDSNRYRCSLALLPPAVKA